MNKKEYVVVLNIEADTLETMYEIIEVNDFNEDIHIKLDSPKSLAACAVIMNGFIKDIMKTYTSYVLNGNLSNSIKDGRYAFFYQNNTKIAVIYVQDGFCIFDNKYNGEETICLSTFAINFEDLSNLFNKETETVHMDFESLRSEPDVEDIVEQKSEEDVSVKEKIEVTRTDIDSLSIEDIYRLGN